MQPTYFGIKTFRLNIRLKFLLVTGGLIFAVQARAQEVEVVKFDQLNRYINQKNGKIKVVNFWATWCKPCIEELDYFEAINRDYKSENIQVILVSFDFPTQVESKLIPFLKKRNIKSKVILLGETDFNSFIDKIDERWSGSIPATLIVDGRTGKKDFYEKQFQPGELEDMVKQYIN